MKAVLILKFPYTSLFGGGEMHTLTLVQELQKKGINFHVLTSCPVLLKEFRNRKWRVKKTWAGPEPVSKGTIAAWPFISGFAFLNLARQLLYYRVFKRVGVVYCLSLTEKILITPFARLLGMRVIWVEHVTFDRWLTQNPLRVLYRWFSRMVTIIAISQVVRNQLMEELRVHSNNITLIYTGVDTNQFMLRDARWGDAARYNIGCVARLEKEKGVEFLIQAIKIIRDIIPYARLIIVGEGPEQKKLAWLAERLNLQEAIQWVGYQQAIEKWYGYFDVYALPSLIRESFGITLVEAMASGVPVVASRIGGIPEIIEHKVTGLLANPGDSQHFADQLLYLYNNRSAAREMALTARKRVEERFSQERMIRDYYLLLRT